MAFLNKLGIKNDYNYPLKIQNLFREFIESQSDLDNETIDAVLMRLKFANENLAPLYHSGDKILQN